MSSNPSLDKNKSLKKVFWSPAATWKQESNNIKIEIFLYKGIITKLFPKFYFLTQKGIEVESLINEFKDVETNNLVGFINDLIKKKILVTSILTPAEIFYSQSYIFDNKYSKEIKINEEKLNDFKYKQLTRSRNFNFDEKLLLNDKENFPEFITDRKTLRSFNATKKISFQVFSSLLASFRQRKNENGEIRYYYASAGGLYPIDVYLYVKEDRVDNLRKGIYYYDPEDNSINMVNSKCEINADYHYFTNESISKESAFSIFFIYNAEANMPKYGGNGYLYALIDGGIMVGTLTSIAELNGIGLCSIGESNFKKIEKYFNLNKNQVYIHSIELGLKK